MFPKTSQNENKPKDPIVQEEVKVENNGIQPIGNEGAQGVPPVGPGAGNEAMNAEIVDQALNIINNQEEEAPQQDVYYDQMEQKPLFYQDPEEEEQQAEEPKVENLDDIMNALDERNPLNRDMIVNRPKRKKIKDSIKKKKKKKNAEIDQINNSMKAIGGLNFNVQKLPEREKTSGWRRFLTGTARFFGATFGKAINVVQNLFRGTYWSKKYRQSQSNNTNNPKITQNKRNHNLIPGWEGKRYEKDPGGEDDIMADFRRVPTVWSYVTAGKAQDDRGNPLPPKISVNVNQPKEAVDQTMSGLEMGHSGLGLEYSRYSQISGRYERYALKYGFYMAGANLSTTSLSSTRGGRFPGQLMDEKGAAWTVSRTFPAKNKQINDIIKASETYADGGYNGLTRNCTSFVKEMVQDVAHLPVPGNIFQMENPAVSSAGNFGIFAGTARDTNAKISTENRLEELAHQEDKSYAGMGNKRVTKQDYRNYKEHQNDQNTVHALADIPNAVAENMRRLEGDGSGTISSSSYQGTMEGLETPPKLLDYINAVRSEQGKLQEVILKATGKRNFNDLLMAVSQSHEAGNLIMGIQYYSEPLTSLALHIDDHDAMRRARAELDKQIDDLNSLLYKVFSNDKRLHVPVMHMISLLQNAADFVDSLYGKADYGKDRDGDLGNLRSRAKFETFAAKTGNDISILMTPSHYEAYIQIYKDPDLAIRKYSEFASLKEIQNNNTRSLTSREKDDLSKGERIEKLADQFDRAHDYMLEKTSYTQQDIDYAFDLEKKENSGNAYGEIMENSAGKIYKSLILEKIFGGMKQRFLNHISDAKAENPDIIQAWLDDDMYACMNRKKDDVKAIMKAMRRTAEESQQGDPEIMTALFYGMIQESWLYPAFRTNVPETGPLRKMQDEIPEYWGGISDNKNSRTHMLIDTLIREVFADEGVMQKVSLW